MNDDSPPAPSRPPHPLAIALIERLRERPGARVLEIGAGSGRNTIALRNAGFIVVNPEDAHAPCAGALSTHDLLHGTPQSIAARLEMIAGLLQPRAPLHATFGSTRDARYGRGEEREPYVYAAIDGDESGIPHVYFDRERLQPMLERHFEVESLDEVSVDDVAGRWAHARTPLRGAVHWLAVLRRRVAPG
jgi:hypothetical protein